jgi:hypothetical protein
MLHSAWLLDMPKAPGQEAYVKQIWTEPVTGRPNVNKRSGERRAIMLPARLTWKDQHGNARFASVVTRNVSEYGVYVECQSPVSISLFRLVQFQLERDVRSVDLLPESLKQGRILSAVYRISPGTTAGVRQGLALRLMVDPKRSAQQPMEIRATA